MSFNITRVLAIAAVAAVAAGLGACGSEDKPAGSAAKPAQPAQPAAAAPAIPSELVGTYERRITSADIDRTDRIRDESSAGQEKPKPGPGRLVISASEPMKYVDLGESPPFTIEQNVTANSSRLAIDGYEHPERGSFCGPEIAQNASYSSTLDGGILTLKALDDPCADRDSVLSGAWKRRP
jgi:hypothetical protein